jgi:hypothetical protein
VTAATPERPDPFWDVVRRRHPDVDVVLLPDRGPAPDASGLPPTELDHDVVGRLDAGPLLLWRALVDADLPFPDSRWTGGPTRDVVRRELTLTSDGFDPVEATALVHEAAASLRESGWHVLAPPDGMPRALASRAAPEGLDGREELQLVLVPGSGRVVLRWRSAGIPVGRTTARQLVMRGAR